MNEEPDNTGTRATLARSLPCRQCGYDLRGLPLRGECPECGFAVGATVESAVDPAAHRLPSLRSPRRVGNGLVAIVLLLLAVTLLAFARPVAIAIGWAVPAAEGVATWTPAWLTLLAGALLLGLPWPVRAVAPPADASDEEVVRADVARLSLGALATGALLIATGLASMGSRPAPLVACGLGAAAMTGAIVLLHGLRGVLVAIGERSREFRTARWSRQRIRDLMVALAVMAGGRLMQIAGPPGTPREGGRFDVFVIAGMIGTVLVWTCALMLVVGLAYLLVNAWWIRRSLTRPPPTLRQLLGAGRSLD